MLRNYWIFVFIPFSDYYPSNSEALLKKVEISHKWSIGKRTMHRNTLNCEDLVLFYQGGDEGKIILGCAELTSPLQIFNQDYFVELKNIEFWANPLSIKKLVRNLSFVRSKDWGLYFRGGVVKVAEKDYQKIVKAHNQEIQAKDCKPDPQGQ
jgi:hypothetical protein